MTCSVYGMAIGTFVPMLGTFSMLLERGALHARARAFDPAVLVNARLAPDMFPLARQVQLACDHAKNGMAALAGREAPRFEDDEQTIDELRSRIARTIDYVRSARAADFEGAAEREITVPLRDGLVLELNGARFLRDWAPPHFYFHVVTAYDILRHNGVEIGKRDYLSDVGDAIRRRGAA